MDTQTVIFIGPQGSGKGTQAALLTRLFNGLGQEKVLHFEAGDGFRALSKEESFTGQRVRETLKEGELQPTFLAARLWSNTFAEELTKDTHMVLDGSPRTLLEARLMNEALEFYQREQLTVIHLDVSKEVTYKRLSTRGRSDDNRKAIERRLRQYEEHTTSVIDFYKEAEGYRYAKFDGEESIEAVHKEIRNLLDV